MKKIDLAHLVNPVKKSGCSAVSVFSLTEKKYQACVTWQFATHRMGQVHAQQSIL